MMAKLMAHSADCFLWQYKCLLASFFSRESSFFSEKYKKDALYLILWAHQRFRIKCYVQHVCCVWFEFRFDFSIGFGLVWYVWLPSSFRFSLDTETTPLTWSVKENRERIVGSDAWNWIEECIYSWIPLGIRLNAKQIHYEEHVIGFQNELSMVQ